MANYSKFESNRSLEEALNIYEQRIADAKSNYVKHNTSFKLRPCPFCGDDRYDLLDEFHESFKIAKCKQCGSEYVNPCPSKEAISDYYSNGKCNRQLAAVTGSRKTSFNVDDRVLSIESAMFDKLVNSKRIKILEVGCSSGLFLSNLRNYMQHKYQDAIFEIFGIDLDAEAIKNKVDEFVHLSCNSAESLTDSDSYENNSYDLILHYELIEHLIDPFGFMGSVKKLLKPDGLCIFTTPNSYGAENLAVNYNSRRLLAHGIFPPMHLQAFSTHNISLFAYRLGLDVVQVSTPGKLDVDMITLNKKYLTNDSFVRVANLDDESIKELIQEYTSACYASSHMQCILRNS